MQNTSRSVHAFVNLKKAVQKELFVTPLFSSLDPQRNHKDSARDFANILDPSETRSSKAGGTEACARRYGAGRVRKVSTRGKHRLLGRSAAGAAVWEWRKLGRLRR